MTGPGFYSPPVTDMPVQTVENEVESFEESYRKALDVFVRLLELHNPMVGAHSRRVATAAEFIAIQMNMTAGEIFDISIGSLLHDIGKISIPAPILQKESSQLSVAEKALINEHPVIGEVILKPIRKLDGAGRIIRHHHENFDGTGSPDKLRGEEIPLGSRIIAVADMYDKILYLPSASSLTARRDFAITHLNNNTGKAYDGTVVDLFVEFIDVKDMVDSEIKEVPVPVAKLKRGMVLSQDLYDSQQILVLQKGTKIGERELKRISYSHNVSPILNPANICLD